MRQVALSGAGFLLLLVLSGCGQGKGPAGTGGGASPNGGGQPPAKDPSSGTEKPRIDVIILKIDMPARVNREQEFEFTLELKNNNLQGPAAGTANVDIRASLKHATGATDIPIGSAQFRDLRPQEPQQRRIKVKAPHMPGLWTVRAVIQPFDFRDEANNELEKQLAVD